jgi:uncharacterized protein YlxW (UPF0749 family)
VTQAPVPPRRDPALSLLERISAEALNPGYAAAHQQQESPAHGRAHTARPQRGLRGPVLTALVVALVGAMVGVLVMASRTQSRQVASERDRLIALAAQQRAEAESLADRVGALDDEVAALTDLALQSQAAGSARSEQIAGLGVAAGVSAVQGPGARVVVDDAPAGDTEDEQGQVLDIDLQQVVNGLWQAGAEAVAVNGERIGALSAIRSAEDVVLVNYVPVVAPYEVLAIGDPRTLPTAFLRSDGGAWLQAVQLSAGITFTIDSVSDDQQLSGAPVGPLRYAEPVPAASVGDGDTGGGPG